VDVVPRDGFTVVGGPEVNPDSVTLTGARRLLAGIDEWYTEARSFERRINSVSTTLPLSDSLGGIVRLGVSEAAVTVDVEQVADNTYRDISVRIEHNIDSTKIILLPPTVNLTVRGGINEMANISADSFSVTGDYRSLVRSRSNYFRPTVGIPANLTLLRVTPDSIEYIIRK